MVQLPDIFTLSDPFLVEGVEQYPLLLSDCFFAVLFHLIEFCHLLGCGLCHYIVLNSEMRVGLIVGGLLAFLEVVYFFHSYLRDSHLVLIEHSIKEVVSTLLHGLIMEMLHGPLLLMQQYLIFVHLFV